MNFLLIVLSAILVLGPLVALHEWGHYIVARLCGVKVLTYSIGFGPKLLHWTSKKTGINYAISAVPLGGYVKMLDERESDVAHHEKHLAFNNQHPLKKIAIILAGPMMNFIIAIFLYWLLLMTPSEQLSTKIGSIVANSPASHATLQIGDEITAIDNKSVNTWQAITYALADRMGETGNIKVTVQNTDGTFSHQLPITNFMKSDGKPVDSLESLGILPWQPHIKPIVGEIGENSPAKRQGLQPNDKILSVNNQPISDWINFSQIIRENPEKMLTVNVLRADKTVTLDIIPQVVKDNMGHEYGQIGAGVKRSEVHIPDAYKKTVVYAPLPAMHQALNRTYDLSVMTVKSMGKMVTGLIGLDNISGPITIAKVANQSVNMGWQAVLSFMAIISLSLAVMNLLPIPVLDGGHLVYYTIELIRGKPLSEQVQIVGLNIGMILMGAFMLLAISNDISRLL
ncbi:RIP metalloprotease RseP [Faucicola boevrei]|uniref:RIP metalloprotease RseP n=1 Tax=Faucicola boevrei TaxID=346665 RepID=UPI000374CF85|nr:RIP metalloprotease RseP [Moraxella boevrei]